MLVERHYYTLLEKQSRDHLRLENKRLKLSLQKVASENATVTSLSQINAEFLLGVVNSPSPQKSIFQTISSPHFVPSPSPLAQQVAPSSPYLFHSPSPLARQGAPSPLNLSSPSFPSPFPSPVAPSPPSLRFPSHNNPHVQRRLFEHEPIEQSNLFTFQPPTYLHSPSLSPKSVPAPPSVQPSTQLYSQPQPTSPPQVPSQIYDPYHMGMPPQLMSFEEPFEPTVAATGLSAAGITFCILN